MILKHKHTHVKRTNLLDIIRSMYKTIKTVRRSVLIISSDYLSKNDLTTVQSIGFKQNSKFKMKKNI